MQNTLHVGDIIRERFLVQSLLSNGSFGAVYLVRDQRITQRSSNLFVLKEVINPNRHELYQMTLDGMALRPLWHQALPRVYNVLSDPRHDRVYVHMDYIDGPNLEMLRLLQPEKRFSFLQAIRIMTPIMDAVAYLHSQQPPVIHQDIKPVNVIVPFTKNKLVLVDFGVGKRYNLGSNHPNLRHSLTPYEAPEQYNGEISTRSDIYALGATFYTLLTGIVPVDALYRASKGIDPLQPVDQVVPAISMLVANSIHRAMSLSSNDRFSTVEQFKLALRTDPTWLQSPKLDLRRVLQELDLPLESSPVEQGSPKTIIAPAASLDQQPPLSQAVASVSSQSDSMEQEPAEPVIEPSTVSDVVLSVSSEPETGSTEQEPAEPVIEPSTVSDVVPSVSTHPDPVEQEPTEPVIEPSTVSKVSSVPEQVVSNLAEEPISEQSVARSTTASVPKQPLTVRSKKLRILVPIVVALLIGVIIGAALLFYRIYHASRSATPTTVLLHETVPQSSPEPAAVSSSTPASILYPNLAGSYNGTIYDIAASVNSKMSLTVVQQKRGNISGYFTGLNLNGPFKGFIDASRQLHFIVMDSAGRATLSFDGVIHSDGNLAGNYCSLNQQRQCSGKYGLWSVTSALKR